MTLTVTGLFVLMQDGRLAVIPFGMAAAIAGAVLVGRGKRRTLRTGTPAIGRVTATSLSKGSFGVDYEFATPSGTGRGSAGFDSMRVEPWFGFVPNAGDTVFVVYDPARPSQNTVWSFAKR